MRKLYKLLLEQRRLAFNSLFEMPDCVSGDKYVDLRTGFQFSI